MLFRLPPRVGSTRISRIREIVAYGEHAFEKHDSEMGADADIYSGEYKRSCLDRDEE